MCEVPTLTPAHAILELASSGRTALKTVTEHASTVHSISNSSDTRGPARFVDQGSAAVA